MWKHRDEKDGWEPILVSKEEFYKRKMNLNEQSFDEFANLFPSRLAQSEFSEKAGNEGLLEG